MSSLYMQISDYEGFGVLIAELALGHKLDNGRMPPATAPREPIELPNTAAEFKALLEARGVGTLKQNVRGLVVVQGDEETMVLRLPARSVIAKTIDKYADATAADDYDLPNFYERKPGTDDGLDPLSFWYGRLGDYTLAVCG